MKALIVAGARPNFMKVAPIIRVLEGRGHGRVLVHTGQHYDPQMSEAFFRDLGLPVPDYHLGVGSGSHAKQTARIMESFEPVLLESRPDWLVVVGDVNSTLACALVAAKLRDELHLKIAHVEAGLRSADWRMPEEVNRVLTDRLSDLLLTPSLDAEPNLLAEGLTPQRMAFVGNVMIDTLYDQLPKARSLNTISRLGVTRDEFVLSTLHRPSNVDNPESLEAVLRSLVQLSGRLPVVVPLHPRTKKNANEFGLTHLLDHLHVLEPLGYVEMLSLVDASAAVLTDSGGVQEETTVLGVPCVTLREQTERPATITHGTNRLAPWPLTVDGISSATYDALASGRVGVGERVPVGWDGRAADRIVDALESSFPGQ